MTRTTTPRSFFLKLFIYCSSVFVHNPTMYVLQQFRFHPSVIERKHLEVPVNQLDPNT